MVLWSVFNQLRLRQAGNNSQIGSRSALIDSPSSSHKKNLWHYILFLAVLVAGFIATPSYAELVNHSVGTAATGNTYWNSGGACSSCHGTPPSNAAFNIDTGGPHNSHAYYATDPDNITTGVNAVTNANMTAYKTSAINNRNNLSAYFASLLTPVLASKTGLTLAPGATWPDSHQIAPQSGSDFLVDSTTYSAGNLPTGISISGSTGVISGNVPSNLTTPLSVTVTLRAINSAASTPTGTTSFSLTVQAIQTISFGAAPTVLVGGTGTVGATGGGSGNAVTFTSQTPTFCTVTGTTVTGVSVGTCTIAANQAAGGNYVAATQVTQNFSVGQGNQVVSFGTAPTVLVGSTGNVAATGGASGNTITYASTTTGVCTITGTTVTGVSVGSCTITADQAGNANYNAATQTSQTFSVAKGNQVISFGSAPSVSVGGTGTVSATGGGSGNVVTFASTTTGICTTSGTNGSTVTGVSAGTCIVAADQIGDTQYNAATQTTQSFSIGQGAQTVTFGAAPVGIVVGGTGSVSATASSGLAISSYSSNTPGACTVNSSSGLVTGVSIGTNNCTITATQNGNASYSSAAQTQTFSIGQGSQTISFAAAPSVAVGGTGTASATATSSLAVTYSTASSACSVNASSGLVTGITAGSNNCVIAANQAGDANYSAATQVTQALSIGLGSQTISFGAAPSVAVGGTGTVSATATSGLAVTYSTASSACSVNPTSGLVSGIAAGTNNCVIAANQTGNTNYSAATQVIQTLSIGLGGQTIVFNAAPTINEGGSGTVSATGGGSTSPVVFTSTTTGVCTVSGVNGSTVSASTTGTCTIAANQAADANYSAASQVTQTINIGAAPPVAAAATFQVQLNTATTFDLTPYISGTGTNGNGVTIVWLPSHGTVTANGSSVTYTPNKDYFGQDTFSYKAYSTFGGNVASSAPGLITVNVVGRPDPTQDANTTAMMAAQMQTVQQFARSQISNFEQRFDNLHRMAGGSSYSNSSRQGIGIALQPATTLGNIEAQSAQLRAQDQKSAQTSAVAANAGSANTAVISPAQQPVMAYQNGQQTMTDTDTGLAGLLNGPVGTNLLAALTSNSVNLAALNGALNNSNSPDAVQVWVAGNLKFGSINNGNNAGFTNFRTDGVTIGADKVVSENLVLGVGLGYAFSKAKMVDDNSKVESNGMSVALYGSYQPLPKTFIDGLIGYGVTKFESDRYVASVDDFARGSRRGDQVFASVAASYEFRDAGFMVAPYGRLDLSYNRLKEDTEKGAGLNALHYDDQTSRYTQLSAGVRAEVTHQTNFGLIIPRAKIELQERMLSGGDATIQYADQLGTSYRLSGTKDQSSALVLGVGSNIILKNGVRLALDYQTLRSVGYESSQSVSFRLTKEFGVDNSQIPTVDTSQLAMPKFGVRVDMGYTFDDNINRTKISSEKETDRIFSINLTKNKNIQIRQNTRLVLSGFLGGERAYYFNGLDRVTGGGQAEFQYRTSGDFLAATYGVFGRAATEQFNSVFRDGYRYTAGFTFRKPLTDRISTFAALSHIQKNAKEVTFDTKEISLRGNVDYMLSPDSTLYVTAEYRHGDILSTGAGSLENLDGSTARVRDDVFVRQNYITYRFGGDTVLATLGYNLALGPTDGLDFSWRRVESTPSSVPDYVAHKKSYVDNQYSIVYLVRF